MGVHSNISHEKWPKQGSYLGKECRVLFNYSEPEFAGTVVRDDAEEPYISIIQLKNGQYVLTTECQWSPL